MFNVKKSSYTFQKLFNEYKNNRQFGKKYKNFSILMFFDQHRNRVEDNEKEEDFLFRDLKNMRREEKELIEEYGTNAKNEFHNIKDKNFKIKLEKNIFFNGIDTTERNINKNNKKIIKINEINLPNIFNKRNNSINNLDLIKNSVEELKNKINNENNNNNINLSKKNSIKKIKSRNNSLINKLYSYNSNENIKNNIKIKHQRNKSYNYHSIDNNLNNNDYHHERKNYIQTLNDERNKFIKEKNKYYYVFNLNQKNSERLDRKLNYIETKYFNN